ncbi:MAG TPA: ABC transporter permease [Micromonosporaceae bacterium]|nr:ABC transporter permease [Micromonosporaceae bacterium]HCU51498.1 ABC transporter permease [Micromonosporaceae bacterium]
MTALDLPIRATTTRRRVLRRILRNPLALGGLVIVCVAAFVALFAGLIAPYPFDQVNFQTPLQPPSGKHWFGTDSIGRDQLSRAIYGLRASVAVGLLSVVLSLSVGVPLGLFAGFYGLLDPLVSRLTDTLLAFPFLVLAVGLAAILGPSLSTAIIAIGIAQIPAVVRVTRSETLRLREMDFVSAAVADGASDPVLLRRHILPNATNALIVQATVAVPGAIIGEAVLSFLGLGVRPPTPSLGVMLADAQTFVRDGPWMAVFPGVTIVVITLALNLLGDGLRDALDPRESRS